MADPPGPRRGEVWLVAFDASVGGEIQNPRPAVVPSNDTADALLNRVQVVPITGAVGRLYWAEACVTLCGERRKAMADRIATAIKRRLQRCMGQLARDDVDAVARAICLRPGLRPVTPRPLSPPPRATAPPARRSPSSASR